jgi:hypothetical protein
MEENKMVWESQYNIFEEARGAGEEVPSTGVHINGEFIAVEPGTVFGETVVNLAAEARYGKFRVFIDGVEIVDPSAAPYTFAEGLQVDIRGYDGAGV